MSPEERKRRYIEAKVHLDFCAKLYAMQHEAGRLFLHEHPEKATSWQEPCMINLKNMKDILHVVADQCQFGLTVTVKGTKRLAKKRTGFLTNSPEVAKELARQCQGGHDHQQLEGGNLTKQAQCYPPALCEAICRGAAREKAFRRASHFMIGSVELAADNLGSVHGGSMRRMTSSTRNF